MANLAVVNATGSTVYLKAAGTGSSGDPHVPEQAVTGPLTDTELRASAVAVSLSSVPLPTGAATAARQDTGNTSLATLAGAVAGTEMQVDVLTLPNVTIGAALPAGNNNIGDVGVASMPALSMAEKTMTTVAGTKAAAGDNELIAAPGANTRLVVSAIMAQNESATATTILLKSGANTKRRALLQSQGDGVAWQFPAGREWKLGANEALNLNLSGANSHGYTVDYYTEAV